MFAVPKAKFLKPGMYLQLFTITFLLCCIYSHSYVLFLIICVCVLGMNELNAFPSMCKLSFHAYSMSHVSHDSNRLQKGYEENNVYNRLCNDGAAF